MEVGEPRGAKSVEVLSAWSILLLSRPSTVEFKACPYTHDPAGRRLNTVLPRRSATRKERERGLHLYGESLSPSLHTLSKSTWLLKKFLSTLRGPTTPTQSGTRMQVSSSFDSLGGGPVATIVDIQRPFHPRSGLRKCSLYCTLLFFGMFTGGYGESFLSSVLQCLPLTRPVVVESPRRIVPRRSSSTRYMEQLLWLPCWKPPWSDQCQRVSFCSLHVAV